MILSRSALASLISVLCCCPILPALGDDASAGTVGAIAPRPLVDFSAAGVETKFTPSSAQVTVAPSTSPTGITVTVQPGIAKYPGITLKPDSGQTWDLSPFGHIEATITNLSDKPKAFGLRIDGASWQDNSASLTRIKPGETAVAKVYFGYSYGAKSNPLKTSTLSELLIVAPAAKDAAETFRVELIQAAGTAGEAPPIDPGTVRITPPNGVLIGPGAKPLDSVKNVVAKGGASASLTDAAGGQNLKLTFPATKSLEVAGLKPEMGKWGLTDGIEVRAKVRNDGSAPVTPKIHIDSSGGAIEATTDAPLAPGAETEIVVDYRNPKIWQNPSTDSTATESGAAQAGDVSGKSTSAAVAAIPGAGNAFASNQVSQILFSVPPSDADSTLTIESLKTDMPPYNPPDWLGKKPPVDGDWTQTLDEEFTGTAVDETRWNVKGPNYYDQRSHYSKDNLMVKDGVLTIRYEKKTGHQNDDPSQKETDYAVGYLDSFGKWTQRYGYWECKMKLPKAPGLWPAFWLMPDRGEGAEHRNSTKFGGMEFDILEHLTGWGPNRYNIAMHWDGYQKEHKATGSTMNYVQPDDDGWITAGLLWTPGSAVYYANGKEILRFTNDRVSNVESDILLSEPSGGWDNLPLEDAKLPADWVIKYVRVWQRKDLASPEDGPKTPKGPIPDH
jgi:beta-glucanase (GH16 family)